MKVFEDKQLEERAETTKRAAAVLKRVISVLDQPCFVRFADQDTEDYQIGELRGVLEVLEMPSLAPSDEVSVAVLRSEAREWVIEEVKEFMGESATDAIVDELVDKLIEHFGNDLDQWVQDNLKSFFNRDDIVKLMEG